ncbi:MAG: AMIN domain-containing protein [Gammaproteobacteria bacterium]|nr:AMIN domain-containing protein [Gammaproteobacteria bacterium]
MNMRQEMTQSSRAKGAWLGSLTLLCLLLLTPSLAAAQDQTLDGISYSALPGDRVEVKLQLSQPLTEDPMHFTIDNPARIALDFPGTGLNLDEKTQSIGVGMAHSISAVEASGRTRVVLNLTQSVPYEMRTEGNNVVLVLEGAGESAPARASSTRRTVSDERISGAGVSASIENVDFRRGEAGRRTCDCQAFRPLCRC